MSAIETVRASVEKKLASLEHQAAALEAQLTQTREQVLERVEMGKRQLRDLLTSVWQELSASPGVADRVKAELQTALDHLQVQLALGKAEARDALDAQRDKIVQALRQFERLHLRGRAVDDEVPLQRVGAGDGIPGQCGLGTVRCADIQAHWNRAGQTSVSVSRERTRYTRQEEH